MSIIRLFLFGSILFSACNGEEGIDADDLYVPAGYALSAGTSTVFTRSTFAYDSDASWLSGTYKSRFNSGDRLYDDVRTSSNGLGGGLGPVYAGDINQHG